jgi:tetratricopeptide (TPR) repeat protein
MKPCLVRGTFDDVTSCWGRDKALDSFCKLLSQQEAGGPRSILVDGESGVGKSHFLRAVSFKVHAPEQRQYTVFCDDEVQCARHVIERCTHVVSNYGFDTLELDTLLTSLPRVSFLSRFEDPPELKVATELFFELLQRSEVKIVVFIDGINFTRPYLTSWLQHVFKDERARSLIFVSSTNESCSSLLPLEDIDESITISPFSYKESLSYLFNHGVRCEAMAQHIARASRGNLAILAFLGGMLSWTTDNIESSDDAAELFPINLFLRYSPFKAAANSVLCAAIPRICSEKAFSVAASGSIVNLFEWLKKQTFVAQRGDHAFVFHPRVRELLLTHFRAHNPTGFAEAHRRVHSLMSLGSRPFSEIKASDIDLPHLIKGKCEEVYHSFSIASVRRDDFIPSYALLGDVAERVSYSEYLGRQGRNVDALYHLNAALSLWPDHVDALMNRAQVQASLGNIDESFRDASEAIKRDDQSSMYSAALSEILKLHGKYEEALERAEKTLAIDKRSEIALRVKAQCLSALHRHDEAIDSFTELLALRPNNGWYRGMRAFEYAQTKRHEAALEDFSIARAQGYSNVVLDYNISGCLIACRKYEEAIKLISPLLTSFPKDVCLHGRRGISYLKLNLLDDALNDFETILAKDNTHSASRFNRGIVLAEKGRLTEALADLSFVVEQKDLAYEQALEKRMKVLEALKRYEDFLADTGLFFEFQPAYALRLRGKALLLLERSEEAIGAFSESLALEENPSSYLSRASVHLSLRNADACIDDCNKALLLSTSQPLLALELRGKGLLHSARYVEALDDFNKILETTRHPIPILECRGKVYLSLGRYHEAISDFSTVLVEKPESLPALLARAEACVGAKSYAHAVLDLTAALAITPDSTFVLNRRGSALVQAGEYLKAIADLDRVIEDEPLHIAALLNRARAYHDLKDRMSAIADLILVLDEKPDSVAALVLRAECYFGEKLYDLALADIESALLLQPTTLRLSRLRDKIAKFAAL